MTQQEKQELRNLFEEKLNQWEKEKGGELCGALLEWGGAAAAAGVLKEDQTLWDLIESQILYIASIKNITPRNLIEVLFKAEHAETFMLALQCQKGTLSKLAE